MPATSQDVLPLLVADLADAEDFGVLRACADAHEVVVVPLIAAPVDRRRHLLEAYAPGVDAPERFLAEPVGGPTEQGFPLRLEPYADPSVQRAARGGDAIASKGTRPDAVLRPRQATSPHLSRGQTRDLELETETSGLPVSDAHVGRLLADGKYLLDESIGVGGMGEVYRAHHRDLDKHVAVKMLHPGLLADPTFARRFKAEALTMSRIDHPSVARVLDFGQEPDGTLYLVMEYLEGTSLEAIFESEGPLALERLVRIIIEVSGALAHVHRHGIIHRDVKPSNILIVAGQDDDGMPTESAKVCDFGIALARGDGSAATAGTPEYMSPEQCRGADVDQRSDVYSLGVMLYELSTGRLPFEGDAMTVMRQHLTEAPPPPSTYVPDLDPLFEQIVMKALEKEPSARQPSMRHLRTELRELLAPVLLDAAPMSVPDVSIPPAVPPTDAAAGGEGESWLEGRDAGMSAFFTTLADTVDHMKIYHESDETANQLAADPTPWLMEMAGIIDEAKFGERAEILARAVRRLLKTGEAAALSAVVTVMRRILREEAATGGSQRMAAAGNVLRVMREPAALATLVDLALGGAEEPARELQHVLVETQAAGASALFAGRSERHATPIARVRFAALVAQIGVASMPILRDALHAALARGERSGPIVEDVLRAIPPVPDETTGKVVAEFLRGGSPAVMAHALVALTSLWGDRARPMLHGALANSDDTVRMGALAGLRRMHAIDALVVRQIAPLLLPTRTGGPHDDLRLAAIAALVEAVPAAKSEAVAALVRAFARSAGSSGPVVLGLAQAVVAVGAPNAMLMVEERAAASPEPLRRHLLAAIGRHSSSG